MPVSSFSSWGKIIQTADLAKMIAGRQVDVHCHFDERLVIAFKEEGDSDVYLFTNESYAHDKGKNPEWRLPVGVYRVTVSVYYEQGLAQRDFRLTNNGPGRSEVRLEPWHGAA